MAAVLDRKSFVAGIVLCVSFLVLLAELFSPILGGQTPMSKADQFFSSLAKGSLTECAPYCNTDLVKDAARFVGTPFIATIDGKKSAGSIAQLLTEAASCCQVQADGSKLCVSGDLGGLAQAVLADTQDMYYNRGAAVRQRHGLDEREALYCWWIVVDQINQQLKRSGQTKQAGMTQCLLTKGIEASYNFYGIEPVTVRDHALAVALLLLAYVGYTIWLGAGIYLIFRGLGLRAGKKAAPRPPVAALPPELVGKEA